MQKNFSLVFISIQEKCDRCAVHPLLCLKTSCLATDYTQNLRISRCMLKLKLRKFKFRGKKSLSFNLKF